MDLPDDEGWDCPWYNADYDEGCEILHKPFRHKIM